MRDTVAAVLLCYQAFCDIGVMWYHAISALVTKCIKSRKRTLLSSVSSEMVCLL
jgi:hypothetical protein